MFSFLLFLICGSITEGINPKPLLTTIQTSIPPPPKHNARHPHHTLSLLPNNLPPCKHHRHSPQNHKRQSGINKRPISTLRQCRYNNGSMFRNRRFVVGYIFWVVVEEEDEE
ncbi:hypothetical protein B0J14DRAFT_584603 [Halenospora varia]|nr:hypothetical protein B0J14DRAFT_584603 [Halenospora varia]